MTNALRSSVFGLAVIAAACGRNDNKTVAASRTVDVLAQDTTLDLAPKTTDQTLGPQDVGALAASGVVTAAPSAAAAPVIASATPARSVAKHKPRAILASQTQRTIHARRSSSRTSRRVASASVSSRRTSTRKRTATQPDVVANNTTTIDMAPVESRAASHATRAVFAAGSELTFASQEKVCTDGVSVGNRFQTQLADQVVGTNGAVIPKGSAATAVVSSIAKNPRDANDLGLGLKIISVSLNGRMYPVSSEVTSAEFARVRSGSRGSDIAKVATGSVIGAGIGRVLGRNTKATVMGAVGGAAAGAVVANRTATVNKCVPDGGLITARLVQPLEIDAAD